MAKVDLKREHSELYAPRREPVIVDVPELSGQAAQVLHVGPYSAEAPTIERLHTFIAASGYERHGKHHEIYLSDPRRAAPERLRTVIRQPVRPTH